MSQNELRSIKPLKQLVASRLVGVLCCVVLCVYLESCQPASFTSNQGKQPSADGTPHRAHPLGVEVVRVDASISVVNPIDYDECAGLIFLFLLILLVLMVLVLVLHLVWLSPFVEMGCVLRWKVECREVLETDVQKDESWRMKKMRNEIPTWVTLDEIKLFFSYFTE